MPYGLTYNEIKEMVGKEVLWVPTARDIVRRSGYRPGGGLERGGVPILSITPADCPRPPYDSYTDGMTPGERDTFYETVDLAETGDAGALNDMRDYLIDFGLEDELVILGVMPLLGYDYVDEVYTFTLDDAAGCPIEIDIAPPAQGFWEQYKDGDTRFTTKDVFIRPHQDLKFLLKSFSLETGAATYDNDLISGGHISFLKDDQTTAVVGYRASYNPEPTVPPAPPSEMEVWLTDEHNLNQHALDPPESVVSADTNQNFLSPYIGVNKVTLHDTLSSKQTAFPAYFAYTSDPPTTPPSTLSQYVAFRSFQNIPPGAVTSSTTKEDYAITKKDLSSSHDVSWSVDPAPGDQRLRYFNEWPTFDVVAVRMSGISAPLSVGTHLYPLDLEHYITLWDIANAKEGRMSVVVKAAPDPGATLRPVWATSREDIISGDWSYFTNGVTCDAPGFYESEWIELPPEAINAGDVYVGFVVEVAETVDNLILGLAEVQVR